MNEQQVEFLFAKAQESLDAARLLAQQEHTEFAASRAYYTMFYLAQALLLKKGLSFSSHAAVIANFGKEYAKTGELDSRFHRNLILAQSERNVGDYGIGETVNAQDAEKVIGWAADFLAAAQTYLAS
jgi:uncharacterized protein (UPF0332 family)